MICSLPLGRAMGLASLLVLLFGVMRESPNAYGQTSQTQKTATVGLLNAAPPETATQEHPTAAEQYALVNFTPDDLDTLTALLVDDSARDAWPKIMYTLGMLGSAYPERIPAAPVIDFIESCRTRPIDPLLHATLICAHAALGRIGSPEAVTFLTRRAFSDAWKHQGGYQLVAASREASLQRMRVLAINGLAFCVHDFSAVKTLLDLSSTEDDPAVRLKISFALQQQVDEQQGRVKRQEFLSSLHPTPVPPPPEECPPPLFDQ